MLNKLRGGGCFYLPITAITYKFTAQCTDAGRFPAYPLTAITETGAAARTRWAYGWMMCVPVVQRHEPNSSFSPSASTTPEGLRKVRDDKGHLSAVPLLSSPPDDGCQLGQALSISLIPFIFITPFSFCPDALFMLPRQYIEFYPDTSIR